MLLYALFISFPARHTDNFRFEGHHCIGDLKSHAMIWKLLYSEFDRWILSAYKPKFQKKATNFADKTIHKNSFLLGFFIRVLGFPIENFVNGKIETPPKRGREVKQFSCKVFFFNYQSWRTLASFGHICVPMHTDLFNILCSSCQGKVEKHVSSINAYAYFLWLIFVWHGLFEIQLTVYSALSRLTDLGIYYITRCGIWLLTIFHIPYIPFQR